MYCPNCKTRKEGRFCPDCGTQLIEEIEQSQLNAVNLSLGDANAISGGVHVTNTTNIVERTKTDNELLHDNEKKFINQCKRCIEDFVISNEELMELESLRLDLGITKERADELLESIRQLAMKASIKAQLSGLGKIKAKQFSDAILKNNKQLLEQMLGSIEALVLSNENEELRFKYYMVLAGLYPERCIEKYKSAANDEYWLCFWTYIAYVKINKMIEAEKLLCELEAKYLGYPSENAVLLAAGGVVISQGLDSIADYLDVIEGDYSPLLQRYVDALYVIVDSNNSIEGCDFYLEYILPVSSQEEVNQRQKEILRLQAIEDSRAKARADKRMIFNEDCSILLGVTEEGKDIVSYELPLCVKQIGELEVDEIRLKDYTSVFEPCSKLEKVILSDNLEIIGRYAFYGCRAEELQIPNSVKRICSWAFQCTKNLKHIEMPLCSMDTEGCFSNSGISSISLPEGMETIGKYMFDSTKELKHITLPSTITSIGYGAFALSAIQEIIIPEGVKEIEDRAFRGCNNLMQVKLPSTITSIGARAFGESAIKEIIIPEGVKEIGEVAFFACSNLMKVKLPSTITSIGKKVFAKSAIQEIIIPEGVKEIGEEAFCECNNLMKVKLPSTITSIGKNAFALSAIQEIIIPEGVKEIGEGAFFKCCNLMQVKLPSTITSIGKQAFTESAIQEIIIPEGVKEIGEAAFFACSNLMQVKLPSTITSIGKAAFMAAAIQEIIIPEGVKEIGVGAFTKSAIQEIIIHEGVKEIEDKAFALCYNLSSITLPKSLFEIKSYAFASCDALKDIYLYGVPKVYGQGIFSQRVVNIHLLDNEPSAQYERFFKLFNYRNSTFYVPNENYALWKKLFKDIEFISESITDIRGEAKTVEEIKKISNEKQEITNKTERSSVDKVQTTKGSQSNIIIDKLWVETDGKKEFTMSWLWTANNMDGHSLKCCVNIKAKSGKDLDFKSITVNKEFQIKGQSFQSKTGISLSYNEFNIAHDEEKKIEFNIEIYDSTTQKCVYTSDNEEFNIWYYFNVFSANIFKLRSGKKYPPGDLTQISFI